MSINSNTMRQVGRKSAVMLRRGVVVGRIHRLRNYRTERWEVIDYMGGRGECDGVLCVLVTSLYAALNCFNEEMGNANPPHHC